MTQDDMTLHDMTQHDMTQHDTSQHDGRVTRRCTTLIVWGCSSGAGKSWIATALCRLAARRGLRVAPFKAQNMSNNARVASGGEIGSAQWLQARAARVTPQTRMAPVLLKPEADTCCQVIVDGQASEILSSMPWRDRSPLLAAHAQRAFASLAADHELLIVEGAGSPAEINLADCDYVNLEVARWAIERGPTRILIVCDIDRGGAFAHLLGTWQLLPDDLRPHVDGFLLNRFRGDAALLEPGPRMLHARTGVPVVGVVPMMPSHGLPEEDGAYERLASEGAGARPIATIVDVAIINLPRASNIDEFESLRTVPGLGLVPIRDREALERLQPALVILPGSKAVRDDLEWMRMHGLDEGLRAHVARGRPLLGICGGMQMLGERIADPEGIEGARPGSCDGLGLLPLHCRFRNPKLLRHWHGLAPTLTGPWSALSGIEMRLYDIRHGRFDAEAIECADKDAPLFVQAGPVLGLSAHGLFENPDARTATLRSIDVVDSAPPAMLDRVFDGLADHLRAHVDHAWLERFFDVSHAVQDSAPAAPFRADAMNAHPSMDATPMIDTLPLVVSPDQDKASSDAARKTQARLDSLTKPLGALGRLEDLVVQCARVRRQPCRALEHAGLFVFAADQGIAASGVSAYPPEVTAQMVRNMLDGGAAVSVLARQHGLALHIADCGVRALGLATRAGPPALHDLRVKGMEDGTNDASVEPAMSETALHEAIGNGVALIRRVPGDAVLLGEMGIGNTSCASLLMCLLTGHPIDACIGRGTGLDDAGLQRKRRVLRRAEQRARTALADDRGSGNGVKAGGAGHALQVLQQVGGLEIATMVGSIIAAASDRRLVVVDGFITTAAVAIAERLRPGVLAHCVFSHVSGEPGHALWLQSLGVEALLSLGMRLGEGSGAAIAWSLIRSALKLADQMASFESAAVSTRRAD